MNNKSYHQNRTARRTILSLLSCFNRFNSASSTSLRSGFRNRLIHDHFWSNALIILVMLLQIVWIVEFTRQNSRHTSGLFFPFHISRTNLTFSFWRSKPLFCLWLCLSLCLLLTKISFSQNTTIYSIWDPILWHWTCHVHVLKCLPDDNYL